MHFRLLRWLVLGFACLWLGVLVPVHQRGIIQLPGGKNSATAAAMPCHGKCGKTKPSTAPTPAQRENCAVCHFILGLHLPPPVTIYVAPLGVVESLNVEQSPAILRRHSALPFHGLDPPAA
jgi:hypothetical protein